jgi:dephospho-CoA kinase
MRLSIEVTPEQHQRLKAVAALRGQSIKDYVLDRVLPETPAAEDDEALRQLEEFLEPRLKAAQRAVIHKSVEQIFEETHKEMR